MEDNANKDNISRQYNDTARLSEPVQVPPSLLPAVLHRLGLTPEQEQQEISLEEAIARLKSDDWEERAMAVRLLGKRAEAVPVELLESALDDEDGAVRAAAVRAMGNVGKPAPMERLMRALHDSDWHVRETAVFVLGKQGPHVPDEVFKMALYDTDSSVREAARYTLQRHASQAETSAVYGQLQEKKSMQQGSDAVQMTGQEGRPSYETVEDRVLHEQIQAYAPQEQISHDYSEDMFSGAKIKSPPARFSSKKWWFIIPAVAICFFVLGAMSVGVSTHRVGGQSITQHAVAQPQKVDSVQALFMQEPYKDMFEKEISSGFNLTPKQILARLQMGDQMTDIAGAQGIGSGQLQKIETAAFADTLQAMVNDGALSQADADAWHARNLESAEQVDQWTSMVFVIPTFIPASGR